MRVPCAHGTDTPSIETLTFIPVRSSWKHVRLSQEHDMSSQEQEHVMYMLGQVGKMSCQGRTMSGPVRNM